MTPKQIAQALAALKRHHRGAARVPAPCPKCGKPCAGARLAREHCRVKRP